MMKCPLCGTEFDEGSVVACQSCPLAGKNCNLVCCPNCGYEWPAESRIVARIKSLLQKFGMASEKTR